MTGQGSNRLRHRAVTVAVADGIKQILPVNGKPARIRILEELM